MDDETPRTSDDLREFTVPPWEIGQHIKNLRLKRRLSQPVLADRIGISQRKLSDIEQGLRVIRFSTNEWLDLARELGVSLHEVMGIRRPNGRVEPVARFIDDLDDSDIEALTTMAKRLASARRSPGPDYPHLPGWDRLNAKQQDAIRAAVRQRDRLGWQRVADESDDDYDTGRQSGDGSSN